MSLSSFAPDAPMVLVGAGRMGGALLKGWLDRGLAPEAVVVIDPAPPPDSAAMLAIAGIRAEPVRPRVTAKVVVVAVKPQIIADVLPTLRDLLGGDTVTVSIAAGVRLARLAAGLGDSAIVRAMPNMPAQIGRGITAAVANARVTDDARILVTGMLESVGEVAWVDDEALIDAVTAVSGSGPAYVFLLAECLADAGIAAGLDKYIARRLARATVTGAAELMRRSDLTPAELRRNVTSPNGTTEAALKVLMADDGLPKLLTEAVAAAKRRSEELSG